MLQKDSRYAIIVYHLFQSAYEVTYSSLVERTSTSRSTIMRDLDFIQQNLPDGWELIRRSSEGVSLQVPDGGNLEMITAYFQKQEMFYRMLGEVLLGDGITVQALSSTLHISKSATYRYLDELRDMLELEQLTLTGGEVRIEGEERSIRNFMMSYFDTIDAVLPAFTEAEEKERFLKELSHACAEENLYLHQGAYERLLRVAAVSRHRVSKGYIVAIDESLYQSFSETPYVRVLKHIHHHLAQPANHTDYVKEIMFLALYVLIEEQPKERRREASNIFEDEQDWRVVYQFIEMLERELRTHIMDDNFVYQLTQLLKRKEVQSQLRIQTSLMRKESYYRHFQASPVYEAILRTIQLSGLESFVRFREDDLIDLFLLVQAKLVNNLRHTRVNVLLMTRNLIEKELLYELLSFQFGRALTIYDILYDYQSVLMYDNIEFIISTEPIASNRTRGVPVITVSAVPSPLEMKKIEEKVSAVQDEKATYHLQAECPFYNMMKRSFSGR
ncbi:helix-turn-helix domain-containing protein [Bacillus daqingensis]|uniref:Helix-turn-helix domain-containing protein n=1 Tax=Bacillus daqingensis TaxID=872396 RepID=A0ABV9NX21_9BACI